MCWRFIADTELEPSWAPIHELDGTLGLDNGNSSVYILRDDIATVKKSTRNLITVIRLYNLSDIKYRNLLYFPSLGSHLTIWLPVSKHEKIMSATEFCSCVAFSADIMGAKVARGKWIRGKL